MNCAVITETRQMAIIPQVIESHLSMLPDFDLVVFCSNENKRYFNGIDCTKYIVSVNTLNDYNNLMTSEFYWSKLLAYEHALIFQTDSKILRQGIEEFYKWDYIGAPWKFQDHGGNGGLSLRSPKVMRNIINECHYSGNPYEDVWFSNHLTKYGILAPRNECKKFSCETIFELGTWGYHAIKNHMNHEQIGLIQNQYNGKLKY